MRKIVPICVFACMSLLPQVLEAQTKPKKKTTEDTETAPSKSTKSDDYFDESGDFKHRLQYMFHTNQGIFQIFGSEFNLRLDPSVGYKLTKWASAGVTGGVAYAYARFTSSANEPVLMKAVDYNIGVYARAKLTNSFYLHTDYKSATYERASTNNGRAIIDPNNTSRILTVKQTTPELNFGVAYRSGSAGWGYEMMLLYDFLYKPTYLKDSPLDLKIGFTYNF
ncbi:MAG: hypothetical protein RL329_4176 [Bacteroidota bacterium]